MKSPEGTFQSSGNDKQIPRWPAFTTVKQRGADKELTLNARLSGPAGFADWNTAGQGG